MKQPTETGAQQHLAIDRLRIPEKILLRFFCFPPPGRTYNPDIDDRQENQPRQLTALQHLERDIHCFPAEKLSSLRLLDIGCGKGEFLLNLVKSGLGEAVGLEIRPVFEETQKMLSELNLEKRLHFTTESFSTLQANSFDIVTSQDSFEHFDDPLSILTEAKRTLRPGGKFYLNWGPPWYHPRGVHMFFMMKRPWAHLFFSQRTIMNVRSLYKTDGAQKYHEVEGGLNQMTVSRFMRLTRESGLRIEKLEQVPIRGIRPLVWFPGIREFFTSVVNAILVKPE